MRSVKRLLMVVNPHAGKQHFKGKLLDLIDICTRQGYDTTVLTTQGRGDAAGMVRERAALYEKIICCGGDGTLNEVISGLMACPPQARPPLGYIPAGTTNDLAATLGIDRDPFAACRDIFSGTEIPYDIGSFNEDRCFSYIAAFGAFTEVSYQTPQPLKIPSVILLICSKGPGAFPSCILIGYRCGTMAARSKGTSSSARSATPGRSGDFCTLTVRMQILPTAFLSCFWCGCRAASPASAGFWRDCTAGASMRMRLFSCIPPMPPFSAGRTPHGRSTARTEASTAGVKSATTPGRSAFCMILQLMPRCSGRQKV